MIRNKAYKSFSWKTHQKNWRVQKFNVCQFELTFRCGLHCRHCYTDCYNKPAYFRKELSTEDVKKLLDKIYAAGVIWLCFTGGDPLTRKDFPDIYSYAKNKGFIVTVFTNMYSMDGEILNLFKKKTPFVIEFTLNAATDNLYDKISQVKGSFKQVMKNLNLSLGSNLPIKIKTQITKDNFHELSAIKKFIKSKKLSAHPTIDLYPRLNGDLFPCSLRLSSDELMRLNGKAYTDCSNTQRAKSKTHTASLIMQDKHLFRCAIDNKDGFHIDPYGNTFLCNLLRKPSYNLLKFDIQYAKDKLLPLVRDKTFQTNSKCKTCDMIEYCCNCPGRAYLETKDLEAPVKYYCNIAKSSQQHTQSNF